MPETVLRTDYFDWFNASKESRMERTPEGYLQGRAQVTNVGVFTYRMSDGSLRRELRPPEEVFDDASMESLRGKPVTNDHPTEAVTSENAKELAVGAVGDGVSRTDFHVVAPLTITDGATVAQIEAGKRSLSCGYAAKVVTEKVAYPINDFEGKQVGEKVYECPGTWMGSAYDAIQTKIRYNHVAVVDKGRAGDDAVLRLDGAGVRVSDRTHQDNQDTQRRTNMTKVKLDNGLEYEAVPEIAVEVTRLKKDLDDALELLNEATAEKEDACKKRSEMEASLDAAKEKVAELEKAMAKMQEDSADQTKIDAAVQERLKLLAVAQKAGVQDAEKLDSAELRKKVILSVAPAAKLDGRDQAYIDARFDHAVEELENRSPNDDKNRRDAADLPDSSKRNDGLDDEETARQKYLDRLRGANK